MKSTQFLLLLFSLLTLFSCEKDDSIRFKPDQYTISASGGEVLTSPATNLFDLYGSEIVPYDPKHDPYYTADRVRNIIETDFFTAIRTDDNRIRFVVQPNTTGKERTHRITVWSGDISGHLYLTQTAE